MRYDVNLSQSILNLMEIMCLVQEIMHFPIGWLKLTARISSIDKRNWNMQQSVGKALQEQGHCGTLVPNSVHWFPWAWYGMMIEVGICLGFYIFQYEEALPRDGSPVIRDVEELGRWVTAWKGMTRFTEGACRREGKTEDVFFFLSLYFPDGITCTLGECPRTMSR